MAKDKTVYICQNCSAESAKWLGRCPSCGSWNTFVEEVVRNTVSSKTILPTSRGLAQPVNLKHIASENNRRIDTKINELNRVLGGGLVKGSLVLLGGEPGVGKSTLALQLALHLDHEKILYISGEESLQQIKLRAERINPDTGNCLFANETSLENILSHCQNVQPEVVIIDSIQTIAAENLESATGSISQV